MKHLVFPAALLQLVVCTRRSLGDGHTTPKFIDITKQSGVSFMNAASPTSQKYLPETMVGGVAMFDYDGDGHLDLFFVNGAKLDDPMPAGKAPDKSDQSYWNRLYRNNGDDTFTDVTKKAGVQGYGYGMGAAVGDYNNDGRPDLFVTGVGQNILYRNNGDGTFADVTKEAGVAGSGWSAAACFVDYDRDGHPDLFVARYLDWDFSQNIWCGERRPGYRAYCHPDKFKPVSHLLYRNDGNGHFTDVTRKAGLAESPGKGLGVAIGDFDADGWTDIAVANDSFPQQLFRNRHDGSFQEVGLMTGLAFDDSGRTFAGMGIDFADFDNDGSPDIFINALANQKYAMFRNLKGTFEYVSGSTNVGQISATHSGWGAKFVDVDNDGWKDLFVAQGHVMDNISLTQPWIKYLEPPALMRNKQGKFEDVSAESGEAFKVALAARGAAFGDLDNDGDMDVAINCNNAPAVILRNDTGAGNHWIMINTIGSVSNRDGIGAEVSLTTESGLRQHATVGTGGSYLSSSDKRVHFGLGAGKRIKLLQIKWPSGAVQRIGGCRRQSGAHCARARGFGRSGEENRVGCQAS
ncbi:MAG: CRTAC1 family protein [Pyrinomonadaceae bacterium]